MADMDEILKFPEGMERQGRHYRWVLDEAKHGKQTALQMVRKSADGYTTVKQSDEEGKHFKNDPRAGVDGLIRVGDLVLMSCPKERWEERERQRRAKANPHQAARAVKEEFNATAEANSIRPLKDSEVGS